MTGRRRWTVTLLGAGALLVRPAPEARGQDPAPKAPLVFPTGTESVRLDVHVSRDGKPVTGLRAQDFEVKDERVLQKVRIATREETNVHAILVLDVSSSVLGPRLEALKTAARSLLEALSGQDRATVLAFSHAVRGVGPTAAVPASLQPLIGGLQADGATALHDALYAGLLLADPRHGRPLLVLFSDGLDKVSWLSHEQVLAASRRSEAVVHAVLVGRDEGAGAQPNWYFTPPGYAQWRGGTQVRWERSDARSPLEALTAETGGRVWAAADEALKNGFLAALAEFRQRYLIEFEPGSKRAGWHRLEVKVKGDSTQVRARRGYFYPAPGPRPAAPPEP